MHQSLVNAASLDYQTMRIVTEGIECESILEINSMLNGNAH